MDASALSNVGRLDGDDGSPASCTRLACGPDCVVAVGLCGRLRAWHRDSGAAAEAGSFSWRLVIDESSSFELANSRRSTHPYRFLSAIAPDGRFAVATTSPGGTVALWCTRTWRRLQLVDPVDTEQGREEREARGVFNLRAEHSCLAFAHDHLATGSREGHIRLWRAAKTSAEGCATRQGGELRRRFGTLSGDPGPLAAIVLTPHLLLGVYRSSSGVVDGNEYDGGQSICAWSLGNGTLLWKHAPKLPTPVVGASVCANWLVVLHGPMGDGADADWNQVLGPDDVSGGAADGAARASVLLRSTALGTANSSEVPSGGQRWQALRRGSVAGGAGRLLAWHASEGDDSDGTPTCDAMLALGFAGGGVSLVLPGGGSATAAPSSEPSSASEAPLVCTAAACTADVGAVYLVSPSLLPEGDVTWRAGVLAADAAGDLRIWALRQVIDASGPPPALECLHSFRLGPGMQPSCLGLIGANTFVCGCTDGRIVTASLVPPSQQPSGGMAAVLDSNNSKAVVVDICDGADDGSSRTGSYEWCFDSGAGPQGRGTVRDKRRAFDGWAKTLAFEAGLQQVLAKMNGQRGQHSTSTNGSAAGTSSSVPWKRGMHVKLTGLVARPELNGCVGLILDGVDVASGRLPVRIVAPAQHEGREMKVKPSNLRLVT